MKLFDFEDKSTLLEAAIVEAPMNPSSFAQAIETGHAKGVLVGYEFEVCMPHATMQNTQLSAESKDYNKIFNDILEGEEPFAYGELLNIDRLPTATFDKYFKLKPGKSQYASLSALFKTLVPGMLEKAKRIFNTIPENDRKRLLRQVSSQLKNSSKLADQLKFVKTFGQLLNSDEADTIPHSWNLGNSMIELVINIKKYDFLLRKLVGTHDDINKIIRNNFDYNAKDVVIKLWPEFKDGYADDDDSDEYYDYPFLKPSKILKNSLEAIGYKTNIFHSYHQARKNLTDWYVEPDGSLEPNRNSNDGAAEVVSPPLPAKESVEALKKFYALAKKLKLYTSKENNTGLHINVSIPETLDVLKLAVFLGDQHVLQVFDRSDNDYARSAIGSLTDRLNDISGNTLQTVGTRARKIFNVPGRRTKLDRALLARMIKGVTGDHMASINNTGKYVSFRHVGGDYLNDYQGILNVVGRFVHAMIIASDPDMYKKEYLSKLVKLSEIVKPAPNKEQKPNTFRDALAKIKTTGLTIFKIHMASFRARASFAGMLTNNTNWQTTSFLERNDLHPSITNDNSTKNSNAAKQYIVAKILDPTLRAKVKALPIQNFATINVVPGPEFLIKGTLQYRMPPGVQSLSGDRSSVGCMAIETGTLPATSPEAEAAFIALQKAYINWRKATGQWKNSSGQRGVTANRSRPRSTLRPQGYF